MHTRRAVKWDCGEESEARRTVAAVEDCADAQEHGLLHGQERYDYLAHEARVAVSSFFENYHIARHAFERLRRVWAIRARGSVASYYYGTLTPGGVGGGSAPVVVLKMKNGFF